MNVVARERAIALMRTALRQKSDGKNRTSKSKTPIEKRQTQTHTHTHWLVCFGWTSVFIIIILHCNVSATVSIFHVDDCIPKSRMTAHWRTKWKIHCTRLFYETNTNLQPLIFGFANELQFALLLLTSKPNETKSYTLERLGFFFE